MKYRINVLARLTIILYIVDFVLSKDFFTFCLYAYADIDIKLMFVTKCVITAQKV